MQTFFFFNLQFNSTTAPNKGTTEGFMLDLDTNKLSKRDQTSTRDSNAVHRERNKTHERARKKKKKCN